MFACGPCAECVEPWAWASSRRGRGLAAGVGVKAGSSISVKLAAAGRPLVPLPAPPLHLPQPYVKINLQPASIPRPLPLLLPSTTRSITPAMQPQRVTIQASGRSGHHLRVLWWCVSRWAPYGGVAAPLVRTYCGP